MNLAKDALFRCRQRGPDLRGMMTIIVNHADSSRPPAQLESPVNPAKLVETRADCVHFYIQSHSYRDCRRSIEYVVHAWHMQGELAQIFFLITHVKSAQGLAFNSHTRRRRIVVQFD